LTEHDEIPKFGNPKSIPKIQIETLIRTKIGPWKLLPWSSAILAIGIPARRCHWCRPKIGGSSVPPSSRPVETVAAAAAVAVIVCALRAVVTAPARGLQ
jgi:hypothetical protein